jgi:hypothetical protein
MSSSSLKEPYSALLRAEHAGRTLFNPLDYFELLPSHGRLRLPASDEKYAIIQGKGIGAKLMVLTLSDLKFLKVLKAAGDLGRNVRELNIRVTLDRLVKGGYLVGRPTDRHSVQYRITQRGRDAIEEHDS